MKGKGGREGNGRLRAPQCPPHLVPAGDTPECLGLSLFNKFSEAPDTNKHGRQAVSQG